MKASCSSTAGAASPALSSPTPASRPRRSSAATCGSSPSVRAGSVLVGRSLLVVPPTHTRPPADNCHKNCSDQGVCHYGHCICDPGFYGADCSNSASQKETWVHLPAPHTTDPSSLPSPAVSCPGDFCFYDPDTLEQVCTHCCHATHTHVDGENYTISERKVRPAAAAAAALCSAPVVTRSPGSVRPRAPRRVPRPMRRFWPVPVRAAVHHRRLQRRCVIPA